MVRSKDKTSMSQADCSSISSVSETRKTRFDIIAREMKRVSEFHGACEIDNKRVKANIPHDQSHSLLVENSLVFTGQIFNDAYCDTCDRGFSNHAGLKLHIKSHVKCEDSRCKISGCRVAVWLHRSQQHAPWVYGVFEKMLATESRIGVEKWRTERKYKFPRITSPESYGIITSISPSVKILSSAYCNAYEMVSYVPQMSHNCRTIVSAESEEGKGKWRVMRKSGPRFYSIAPSFEGIDCRDFFPAPPSPPRQPVPHSTVSSHDENRLLLDDIDPDDHITFNDIFKGFISMSAHT